MKKIELPDCLYSFAGFSKDSNGNSIAKFINETTGKGFSIQTNQNLPKTHSMRSEDLKDLTDKDLEVIKKELLSYVKDNGTSAMKTGKTESIYYEKAKSLILGGLNLKEAKNKNIKKILDSYLNAALWTSELDEDYDISDINKDSIRNSKDVILKFVRDSGSLLDSLPEETIGHSLWISRGGYGDGLSALSMEGYDKDIVNKLEGIAMKNRFDGDVFAENGVVYIEE